MLDIKWSPPYTIKDGSLTKWRREWSIPPAMLGGFFDFWKKNKFKLLADGFSVSKSEYSGKWFLYETKSNTALFRSFEKESKKDNYSPVVLPPYSLKNESGLRPWQVGAVGKLVSAINKWGSAIDGSELGTGKTFSAGGLLRELNCPFVIVCPKPVINQWNKVINNHFSISSNSKGIINYELLIRGRKDSSIASFVLSRQTKRKKFIWKIPKNSIIVWDEAHRLKNFKTRSSKVCMEAYKQGYKQLFLSATLASSPLDLRTVGTCTKMFTGSKSYYEWAYEHGVYKGTWGLEFNDSPKVLKKLHTYLFEERGVRLLRDEIPNFPETEIIVNAYNIEEETADKIRSIYSEMKEELKIISKKEKSDVSEMAVRTRALQKTEMLKIPLIEEMTREGLEAGMSVVVILNYSDSIDALAERFNTKCIYDGRNESTRNIFLELFQSNKEPLIIANMAAVREGLNMGDEHGGHPRLSILSPNYSIIKLLQSLGRTHRENSKSKSIQKLIYIANTQEEEVVDRVGKSLENLTLINNGKISDSDLKI